MPDSAPKPPSKIAAALSTLLFAIFTVLSLVFLYAGPIVDSPSAWRREPFIFYPAMTMCAIVFASFTVIGIRRVRSL